MSAEIGGRTILSDVSFDISPGEILGIIGPNGAGKSTLARALCGGQKLSNGSVQIGAQPISDRSVRARIGYAPQSAALFGKLTALENLRILARLAGLNSGDIEGACNRVLEDFSAGHYAHQQCRHLSGGMRQRINLAAALLHKPDFVVMDEPAASLDPDGMALLDRLTDRLTQEGTAVVIVTHDLARAETGCDRVAILVDGVLRQLGAPATLVEAKTRKRLELTLEFDAPLPALPAAGDCHLTSANGLIWRGNVKERQEALSIVAALDGQDGLSPLVSMELRRCGLEAVIEALAKEGDG